MNRKIRFIGLVIFISSLFVVSGCAKSKTGSTSEKHSHSKEKIFTCPMHPEIRQDKPGNCPICHMKLVEVKNQSQKNIKADIDLNISPYQADLVGIKPLKVNKKDVAYTIPVSGRLLSNRSVALQIFEKDLRYIKKGSKFSGYTEAHPDEKVVGEIISIDSFADPSSRTVRVVGSTKSDLTKAFIEASFIAEVQIELGEKLVIPEKAVLFTGRGNIVYIYENQKLRPKHVILGPKVGDNYVVVSGLNEGDNISSGPNFLIDSESKIRGLNDQKHH